MLYSQLKKQVSLVILLFLIPIQSTLAHCQVPCGIYDDHMRVRAMLEDAETVKKAITQINQLASKRDAQSQNQLVRWVINKEEHAQKIISTMSDYFLTQRVKPDTEDYNQRLARHHAVILAAMKAKQNTDIKIANELSLKIEYLARYYPEPGHDNKK